MTLDQFLVNLKTVIASVDPNIGEVFTAPVRFSSQKDLAERATITLQPLSGIDVSGQQGSRALRFWSMSAQTTPQRLTNGSSEYVHAVSIQGFFVGAEDVHHVALRKAAELILEACHAEERTTLATLMGAGYMGFLEDMPRLATSVLPATLGQEEKIHGQTATLVVTYHEEIAN